MESYYNTKETTVHRRKTGNDSRFDTETTWNQKIY